MATADTTDPRATLAALLADRPDLATVAAAIFDYTQYLLDDDERLTKSGALDGEGRELLRARALEALGGVAADGEDEDGEAKAGEPDDGEDEDGEPDDGEAGGDGDDDEDDDDDDDGDDDDD
jgi:hypothetical protein